MIRKFYKSVILLLIFTWFFSYWSLVIAEETATLSPTSTDAIIQNQASTSTDTFIVNTAEKKASEKIGEEETTLEDVAPEEFVPEKEPTPPPRPQLKERTLHKDFRIAQNAGHRCDAEIFSIDISGRTSTQTRILLGGKKVQLGELEIGSLPIGIDVLFLKNRDYLESVSQNDGAFDIEIVNQEGSQKGSFNVPILYTDRENNQITVCQINIVNF